MQPARQRRSERFWPLVAPNSGPRRGNAQILRAQHERAKDLRATRERRAYAAEFFHGITFERERPVFFVAAAAGALAGLSAMPHCLGMCGPLAAFACRSSLPAEARGRLARYLGGRLASYGALGALAGAGGARLYGAVAPGWAAALLSLGVALSLGLSAYRLWRGAASCATSPDAKLVTLAPRAGAARAVSSWPERVLGWLPRGPLSLGLLSALLPCGALLAGVLVAAGTGGALLGAAAMLGFATTSGLGLAVAGMVGAHVPQASVRARRVLAAGLALGAIVFALRPLPSLQGADDACHTPATISAPTHASALSSTLDTDGISP